MKHKLWITHAFYLAYCINKEIYKKHRIKGLQVNYFLIAVKNDTLLQNDC